MMNTATIELPWPAAKLGPNARGHWTTKENARGEAKEMGYVNAAFQAGDFCVSGPVQITLIFNPPNRRHFDLDNLIGRMKYVTDGIFLAWGADDVSIRRRVEEFGAVVRGGRVIVKIEPMD